MDDERAHQRHDHLVLPAASELGDDGQDALVGCYRLLVAIARREGVRVGSAGAGEALEERAVGT